MIQNPNKINLHGFAYQFFPWYILENVYLLSTEKSYSQAGPVWIKKSRPMRNSIAMASGRVAKSNAGSSVIFGTWW